MRNLTNCLISGQFAALLITQLVLLLNPNIAVTIRNVAGVWMVLAPTYGIAIGIALWLVLILTEAVRGQSLSPAWLSFRVSTWLLMLTLAGGAALAWHNLILVRLYVPAEHRMGLAMSATVLTTAAAILFVLGLFHYSFGRRGIRLSFVFFGLALTTSLIAPFFLLREPPKPETWPRMPLVDNAAPRRLTIIGIEGASMSYLLPAVAEGHLPNFARLLETGASGALKTLYPTESVPVWTSIATGKLPRKHGLKGFYRYRFPFVSVPVSIRPHGLYFQGLDKLGLVQHSAVTSKLLETQPFWVILSRFGVTQGLVRWWGSYPAESIDGFVVTEYFHRLTREKLKPPLPGLTQPPELYKELLSMVIAPEDFGEDTLSRFIDLTIDTPGDRLTLQSALTRALSEDATYHRVGKMLRERYRPDVFAIYYFGLDIVGHYFTRYHQPESFGDVSDSEKQRYSRVIDAYYHHLDTLIGEYLEYRSPEEILVLVSGHGMEPLSLGRRMIEPLKGNPYLSGYHEGSPDGLLIFHGPDIAQGVKVQGASVVDITPTLLYLMGLPLGQDMDGTLLTDVFKEELIHNQPVTFISSYHNFLVEPRGPGDLLDTSSPLDLLPTLQENQR